MTGKDLLEDMEYISDALIEEALAEQHGSCKRRFPYQKWGKMAACVTVAAVSVTVLWTYIRADRVMEECKEEFSADLNMISDTAQDTEAVSQNADEDISADRVAEKYGEQADTNVGSDVDEAKQSQELYTNVGFEDNMVMGVQGYSAELEADARIVIDTFPPKQMQSEEQGGTACYKAPEKGEWFYFHQLKNALEYYDGTQNATEEESSSVYAYQVVVDVFGDRTETDNEGERIVYGELTASDSGRNLLEAEYQRLLKLGYQVCLSEDYLLTGTFTKAELEQFHASPDYGYAFHFESEY